MSNVISRLWARVENGVITEIKSGEAVVSKAISAVGHPFELLEGERAVDVSNTPAAVGNAVDAKGNVASGHGARKRALAAHEPAYHDGMTVVAADTATTAAKMSTSTPAPVTPTQAQAASAPVAPAPATEAEPVVAPAGPATPVKGK